MLYNTVTALSLFIPQIIIIISYKLLHNAKQKKIK